MSPFGSDYVGVYYVVVNYHFFLPVALSDSVIVVVAGSVVGVVRSAGSVRSPGAYQYPSIRRAPISARRVLICP